MGPVQFGLFPRFFQHKVVVYFGFGAAKMSGLVVSYLTEPGPKCHDDFVSNYSISVEEPGIRCTIG